jgi:integrase
MSTPTVAAYAETWLTNIRHVVREQTLRCHRSVFRAMIVPHLGSTPLAALTRSQVRAWLATLLAEGRAPGYVARAHDVLHTMLNVAIDDEVISANVTRGLARRFRRHTVRARTVLELPALERFLATSERLTPRRYPLFVALAGGGLRIGEAIGLRPEDIDATLPLVLVRRSVRAGGHVGPPKNGTPRTVRFTEAAAGVLRAVPPSRTGWLFPSRRGAGPISAQHTQNLTRRIAAAAGLPTTITPKTFRRSYAATMKAHGADFAWIAAQLGHSSVKITERFYVDGTPPPPPPAILLGR